MLGPLGIDRGMGSEYLQNGFDSGTGLVATGLLGTAPMTIRFVVTLLYIVVGIVNFVPLIGVVGAERLESLYGMPVADEGMSLLLRHRAVLFGLLGAFIVLAAIRAQWRSAATFAGLVSMVAFAALALPIEPHNAELQRVFWIDVGAIVLLLVAYGLSKIRQ